MSPDNWKRLNYDDLSDPCWDRYKQAWQLRKEGKTYDQIADMMGYANATWARQLVFKWARLTRAPAPYSTTRRWRGGR